ncbi:CoA-disulfide reductase [Flexistipes sinusarabici DSM 4947]|uniref:CoA-disulfide reductase n=1 Tax=Flexistipes sinusarabici (strain ATCC 49648 / DSM 4947 / MAS 10) TaxID=717231 RepID=F8E920_FLESM|nr:FAD-dependent oxidoreductase [Flexistipes sinusarabici]AEI15222.1 CoA-disulfide reductase [Flexistipes sinusarabici DSM 4947]
MKVAVIGGIAAGLSAASRVKKENKNAEVVVFEKRGDLSYGACGMPYNLTMENSPPESLYALDYQTITQKRGIDYRLYTQVNEILPEKNKLKVYDFNNNERYDYHYDYLVCATGAIYNRLDFEGFDERVFYFKNLNHLRNLKNFLYKNKPKKACLVGAGYINLELAENLVNLGIDVTIIEKSDRLLPFLPVEQQQFALSHLESKGVKVFLNTDIISKQGNLFNTSKGTFECDFVVVAIGVKPNTEIFHGSGITLGIKNAVKVNHNLQTNIENIFAAGDCAEHYVPLLKDWTYMPLGTTANKMGRISGYNIANINNMETFYGINQSAAFRIFDISVATTGLNEKQLSDYKFNYKKTEISIPDRPEYIGGDTQKICLLYDSKTGQIYGAQITGHGTVAKRIDILSTAIHAGMTVEDFSHTDLTYAPPFANVWDSLLVAANVALKNL